MSARGPGDFADAVSSAARDLLGRMRRMAVTLTSSAIWQVAGHVLLDGTRETRKAEVFSGIGFYARPPDSGGTPEAFVVFPGGPESAIIAATRDETTRRAVAGGIQPDETAVFTSKAIIVIKADGTIEIRSAAGVALSLPTLATISAIGTAIAGAVVVAGDGGASLKASILTGLASSLHGVAGTTTWPVGTTKLKAE